MDILSKSNENYVLGNKISDCEEYLELNNEQKEVREDTIIRHYCKVLHWLPYPHTINIKPWHPEEFKKAFGDISSDVIEEYIRIKGDQKNKQEVYDFFNK